jgi:hypothetical protein
MEEGLRTVLELWINVPPSALRLVTTATVNDLLCPLFGQPSQWVGCCYWFKLFFYVLVWFGEYATLLRLMLVCCILSPTH